MAAQWRERPLSPILCASTPRFSVINDHERVESHDLAPQHGIRCCMRRSLARSKRPRLQPQRLMRRYLMVKRRGAPAYFAGAPTSSPRALPYASGQCGKLGDAVTLIDACPGRPNRSVTVAVN